MQAIIVGLTSTELIVTQGEVEAWTPFNSDLQMQGIKVLVTDPLPDQKKGDMFEGTMLLLGMIKDKQENENKRMKVDINNSFIRI